MNIFGHSFVEFLKFLHCNNLNIFEYLNIYRQINSFCKYSLNFEATNVFGYSFVKEKLHLLHTVPYAVCRTVQALPGLLITMETRRGSPADPRPSTDLNSN